MIKRKDAIMELVAAKKVFQKEDSTTSDKLNALWKVVQITLKEVLDVKENTVSIMRKVGAELRKPERDKPENKNNLEVNQKENDEYMDSRRKI